MHKNFWLKTSHFSAIFLACQNVKGLIQGFVMQRKFSFIFFLLLLTPVLADYSVSRVSTIPYPVIPGKSFTIVFGLVNTGKTALDNLTIKVVPSSPFSVTNERTVYSVSKLESDRTANVDFTLWADSTAGEGTYPLKVQTCLAPCGAWIETEFNIYLSGDPVVVIRNITFDEKITPGDNINGKIVIENTGKGIARDIRLTLSTTPSGSTSSNLFAVINSGNTFSAPDLNAGQTAEINFVLGTSKDLSEGIYNLPISLKYSNTTFSDSLGINVLSSASLLLQKLETEPLTVISGQEFLLMVTLANQGSGKAQNIYINITGEGIFGRTTSYINKIDSKDEEVSIFDVKLEKFTKTKVPVNVFVSYTDSEGTHETTFTDVVFVKAPQNNYIQIVFLFIAVALVYIFRKKIPILKEYV